MKKISKLILLTLFMLGGTAAASAGDNKDAGQNAPREELAQRQAKAIAASLKLDESTTQKLVQTYTDCQKEIWEKCPRGKFSRPTTDAEAQEVIKTRFERARQLLDIREKYYKKYSKFLTPLQIEQLYRREDRMMRHLDNMKGKNVRGKMRGAKGRARAQGAKARHEAAKARAEKRKARAQARAERRKNCPNAPQCQAGQAAPAAPAAADKATQE